jgi:dolichyl-diphosphooligosaccharide--protein glycosyltransferase
VHCSSLHKAYTLFFVIGTCGATLVPVVGLTPFKSLEQIGPLLVFFLFQFLELSAWLSRQVFGYQTGSWSEVKVKFTVCLLGALVLAGVAALLVPTGFFGPLSARVRGLFVKHTRTGNPLVDSVAEHQPANPDSFRLFLHHAYYTAQAGLAMAALNFRRWQQSSFLVLFCVIVYFFCLKMSRLLLLAAPVAASLTGIALGLVWDWCVAQIFVVESHTEASDGSQPASGGAYAKYILPLIKRIRALYRHKFTYVIRLVVVAAIVAAAFQNYHYAIEFKGMHSPSHLSLICRSFL